MTALPKHIIPLILIPSISFLQMDCKDEPPVVPPPPPYEQSIFLTVADSGLTEVYLKLSMTDTLPPRGFAVLRNNVQILTGSLFGKETTLVDTTAQLNTSYFYQAFRLENITRKDSSSIVTTKTLDTTSHEFVWKEYTFGNTSSSVFYGTLILNDTTIYALGNIIVGDSVYVIAKGNGTNWQLIKLYYRTDTGDTLKLTAVRDMYLKNSNAISLFGGSIFEWNGSSSVVPLIYSRFSLPNVDGTVDKTFGTNPNNIYAVGRSGSIVYYNGTSWQAQSSGTTVDLTDVWGTPDGSTLWACGYKSDNLRSVFLQYNNSTWQTLWSREGTTPVAPFDFRVTSLWYKKRLYLCNTSHVFTMKNGVTTQISPSFGWLTYRIRGNDENDIVAVTEESAVWHFNGSNWKKVYQNPNQRFRSVAIKGNTVVAVGFDVSTFPNKAVVVVGKRFNN